MTVRHRVTLVLLLVTALSMLMPLAYASPVDPFWESGIYDGADFDDVVTFLLTLQLVPSLPPAAPLFVQIVVVTPHGAVAVLGVPLVRSASSRAPPAPRDRLT